MVLEFGLGKISSKNKIQKLISCKVHNLFCGCVIFLSSSFLLHGESFEQDDEKDTLSQILYDDYEHVNSDVKPFNCGSSCKRPKQGPPGPPAPPLGNYINAYYAGARQPVTAPGVPIPIIFNIVELADGWVVTGGTDFTNTQSGLYLINFGAGIYSGTVFNSDTSIGCFVNGSEYLPAHVYAGFSVDLVSQLTTACILPYNSGDLLQFAFKCSDTSMSLFGNAFVTITRIQ